MSCLDTHGTLAKARVLNELGPKLAFFDAFDNAAVRFSFFREDGELKLSFPYISRELAGVREGLPRFLNADGS
jgi:hypothetical protein